MSDKKSVNNIYDLVEQEKTAYDKEIELIDGWNWSMKKHLRRSFLYLNSQFEDENTNRDLRPSKNIVLPILNIQYRTEGFDVKDIDIYVDNPDDYFKSMLIRKYHHKWALENSIDTFIDEMITSYVTYGGILARKTTEAKPEVIDLKNIAFCNQTSILDYPFAIEHTFSYAQLKKVNKKWGKTEYGATIDIDGLIALTKKAGDEEIKVYEVHGLMPKKWLGESEEGEYMDEDTEDVNQVQIISFYKKEEGSKQGVTLFRMEEPELPFKFLSRDRVEGRALGRGGVEELFESQVWTNWDEIKITEMLDSASKTIHWSDDNSLKAKNNISNLENGQILHLTEGKKIQQLDTFPRNLNIFNDSVERWQNHAQIVGAASEGMLGETPSSGTPFKLYEAQQMEAKSMHRYRQGQLAVFMDEIYRDWILPHLAKEIVKEQTFMQELSIDEMQEVVDKVVTKKTNKFKIGMILALQDVDDTLVEMYKTKVKEEIVKKGNKQFFQILKDEMKDISLSVMTNIAGKQKNLALLTDKLVNVLRQYIATPQIRQDPEMTKLLNMILESSGLAPMTMSTAPVQQMQQMMQPGGGTQPLQQLANTQKQENI